QASRVSTSRQGAVLACGGRCRPLQQRRRPASRNPFRDSLLRAAGVCGRSGEVAFMLQGSKKRASRPAIDLTELFLHACVIRKPLLRIGAAKVENLGTGAGRPQVLIV